MSSLVAMKLWLQSLSLTPTNSLNRLGLGARAKSQSANFTNLESMTEDPQAQRFASTPPQKRMNDPG